MAIATQVTIFLGREFIITDATEYRVGLNESK